MSIYVTIWSIKLEAPWIPNEYVTVWAQGVPAHIGQPDQGYETDPHEDYLPPIIANYDPNREHPYRAVVFVQEGRDKKDYQKYVDPILTITGAEYEAVSFPSLLASLYQGLKKVE